MVLTYPVSTKHKRSFPLRSADGYSEYFRDASDWGATAHLKPLIGGHSAIVFQVVAEEI
jgi:hypothetical protein